MSSRICSRRRPTVSSTTEAKSFPCFPPAGVWFDVGNGQNGHLRWDIVERIMQAGFWPDTFSTDWNVNSPTTGVIDFPNCMSKFLGFGMSVDQVVARATVNASRTFDVFRDRGTLKVGAPADVAVLELRGDVGFWTTIRTSGPAARDSLPSATVLGGRRIPRAPA
jgi:dihydroorotase